MLVRANMNDLIKHFAKDAGINLFFSDKEKLEKFAKSLVEHCAKVCETGNVDGWKIDENISGAFATEIRQSVNKFDKNK